MMKDKIMMTDKKYNELIEQGICPECGEYLTSERQWVGECHGRPMYELVIYCKHCGLNR